MKADWCWIIGVARSPVGARRAVPLQEKNDDTKFMGCNVPRVYVD